MHKGINGFTIVELLIVIVVIAILAAISVVSYSGIQARARDASTDQAISSMKKTLEIYKADNGMYPQACGSNNSGCSVTGVYNNFLVPTYAASAPTDAGLYQYVRNGNDSYGVYLLYNAKASCKTGVNVVSGWWGSGVPIC